MTDGPIIYRPHDTATTSMWAPRQPRAPTPLGNRAHTPATADEIVVGAWETDGWRTHMADPTARSGTPSRGPGNAYSDGARERTVAS